MRADIVPGATFPDYELTDHTKTRRRLSELQGIDPMISVMISARSSRKCVPTGTSRDLACARTGKETGHCTIPTNGVPEKSHTSLIVYCLPYKHIRSAPAYNDWHEAAYAMRRTC